jgi:hypothetical protein
LDDPVIYIEIFIIGFVLGWLFTDLKKETNKDKDKDLKKKPPGKKFKVYNPRNDRWQTFLGRNFSNYEVGNDKKD